MPETLAIILQGQPERLSERFDVAVVSSTSNSNSALTSHSVSSSTQISIPHFSVNMHRGISPLADIKSIVSMVSVLRRFKPDLLHSYTPKAGLVCMVAGVLCGVKVRVHTFTGLIFPTTTHWFKRFVLKQVDALICACATTVVAEGAGVKRDLLSFKVTRKPIQIIGHGNIAGLDSSYFDASLPEVESLVAKLNASSPPDVFIFLYVGRLNRDKGLKELVEAFVELDQHAVLWLVGSLDQTAPPDAATLKVLSTHPRIQNMGFLQDVRGVLARCDVLVLPSYREGFPNVLLQAGAMQKTVIATNINGSNEIVIPNETGWLVPAKDAGALREAMMVAIQTPTQVRLKMGAMARSRIQSLYEREAYIQKLIGFYHSLINRIPGQR